MFLICCWNKSHISECGIYCSTLIKTPFQLGVLLAKEASSWDLRAERVALRETAKILKLFIETEEHKVIKYFSLVNYIVI